MEQNFVIEAQKLTKVYTSGVNEVRALQDVDLQAAPGEMLAIMGASGSGKSTLMNILGCLDVPTAGSYQLDGTEVAGLEPNELSGGQQQRVAIARALVTKPAILLADEPTGNLDSRTTLEVMSLFQEINEQGVTILMVTHEDDVAVYCKRVIELRDGAVVRDEPVLQRRGAASDISEWEAA